MEQMNGGIQVAAFCRSRCRPGSGATWFRTLVVALPGSAGVEVYRVATLTASEHTASRTISAHQRLIPDPFGFAGCSILLTVPELSSI